MVASTWEALMLQRKAQMLDVLGRRRGTGVLALLVCGAAWLGMAQAAQAGTLSKDGSALVYTMDAASAVNNNTRFYHCDPATRSDVCSVESWTIEEFAEPITAAGGSATPAGCVQIFGFSTSVWSCAVTTYSSFSAALTGGNDSFIVSTLSAQQVTIPVNINGGVGDDSLNGTIVGDSLDGDLGNDSVNGGDGDDSLAGNDGNDTVLGGEGNDTISGGSGADLQDGQNGFDTVNYSQRTTPVSVTLDGAANDGNSTTDDNPGAVTATGDDNVVGIERVLGGSGADILNAVNSPVAVTLEGGGGDDLMSGSDFADTFLGGGGGDLMNGRGQATGTRDVVSYQDHGSTGVTVTMNSGNGNDGNQEDGNAGDRDTVNNIEELIGSGAADDLTGDGNPNTIHGRGGNDVVRGGGGKDTLRANPGTDTVSYSDRPSSVDVDVSLDGAANDGAPGEQDDIGNLEFEIIEGGAGDDFLRGVVAGATLRGLGGLDRLVLGNGGGTAFGGDGNDQITGGSGNDTLHGEAGNDTINGLGGADTVRGGDGADNVEARDGVRDDVDCGAGTDTALTDAGDARAQCELPAPPPVIVPPPPPPVIITPPPPPPPGPSLRTPAVTVAYKLFEDPTRTSRFFRLTIKSVPRGSKVVGRCLTKKNKPCKGKLKKRFTKRNARGNFRIKALEMRKYPAGSKLEFVITNPAYVTQIKTMTIKRNADPAIGTRCQDPGSTRRRAC
jgi:Ca2+-binding RTX toxin-like protein